MIDHRCIPACLCALALASPGLSHAESEDDAPLNNTAKRDWRIELKRQNTGRGTPGESTKTTVRIEHTPDGVIDLIRLDLPFPDVQSDYSGSPFNPRLGDIKLRLGFAATQIAGRPVTSFVEFTAPTADPESLGAGKYQLNVGAKTVAALGPNTDTGLHKWSYSAQVQQNVSMAGDAEAKDINYTKLELGLLDTWRQSYSAKLTFKPVIDWVQDGKSGAVVELEGAVNLSDGWRVSLMGGKRAWGAGVASTYSKRVEFNIGRRF